MVADASIYSMVQPALKPADPLEQFGKTLSLKSMIDEGQLRSLQREGATLDLNEKKSIRDVFDNAMRAGRAPTQAEVDAASPSFGVTYRKATLENNKTLADLGKTRLETAALAAKQYRDQLVNVTTPEEAAAWTTAQYNDPDLKPVVERLSTLDAALKRIPKDPQLFQDFWRRTASNMDQFLKDTAPEGEWIDSGGKKIFVQKNMQAPGGVGPVAGVAPIEKTATIGETESARHNRVEEGQGAARLGIERVKSDPFGVLGINKAPNPSAVSGAALSGDEYLATLAPGVASQVKALAQGKLAITPRTLQSPQGSALLQMAMQYEPGTDQTTYIARAATAKDAATGKLAISNNALNTVAGHLSQLSESADALNNTSFPWVNKVKNFAATATGSPQVNAFNLNLMGVADELERAYRGAGGAAGEIRQWRDTLGDASSPQQFKAALRKGAEMLQSKLEANQAQIDQGMRSTTHGIKTITPKAAAAFQKLMGDDQSGASGGWSVTEVKK